MKNVKSCTFLPKDVKIEQKYLKMPLVGRLPFAQLGRSLSWRLDGVHHCPSKSRPLQDLKRKNAALQKHYSIRTVASCATWIPRMVVPPGEVTSSLSCPVCFPAKCEDIRVGSRRRFETNSRAHLNPETFWRRPASSAQRSGSPGSAAVPSWPPRPPAPQGRRTRRLGPTLPSQWKRPAGSPRPARRFRRCWRGPERAPRLLGWPPRQANTRHTRSRSWREY